MYKSLLRGMPIKVCAAAVCGSLLYSSMKNFESPLTPMRAGTYSLNTSRRYYPASAEYPDLTRNRCIMARNMDKSLYAKLRDRVTANGFTIDDVIQTGVDNPAKFSFTGAVAGDEQSYEAFKELFNRIIKEKHNYESNERHERDLDASKLDSTACLLDPEFVLSIRIRAIRNIRGYCLPSFCTRGERRDLESILVKALYNLDETLQKGTYYALKELSPEEEKILEDNNAFMDKPFAPTDISAGLYRDWPDSRGVWISQDKSLLAYLNRKDHIRLSVIVNNGDFKEAFSKFSQFVQQFESEIKKQKWDVMYNDHLGYITTDPKDLGTGLKLSARLRLPKLSKDGRLSTLLKANKLGLSSRMVAEKVTDSNSDDQVDPVVEVTSTVTLGKSEIEIGQMFVESLNKLIQAEKIIQQGGELDESFYKK